MYGVFGVSEAILMNIHKMHFGAKVTKIIFLLLFYLRLLVINCFVELLENSSFLFETLFLFFDIVYNQNIKSLQRCVNPFLIE